jgi:hypothetical protein
MLGYRLLSIEPLLTRDPEGLETLDTHPPAAPPPSVRQVPTPIARRPRAGA